MAVVDIVLERSSANDEEALVASVFVKSGSLVKADELLFEIENSKAVEEYRAPSSGILVHTLLQQQTVNFGTVIATISPAGEGSIASAVERLEGADVEAKLTIFPLAAKPVADAPHAQAKPVVDEPQKPSPTRTHVTYERPTPQRTNGNGRKHISRAAQRMLDEHALSATDFDTHFLTSRDIKRYLGLSDDLQTFPPRMAAQPAAQPAVQEIVPPRAKAAVEVVGDAVPTRKLAEIRALTAGAGNSMLSVLGVEIGAVRVRRDPSDMLAGLITDLVLYEASRLVRQFPRLNAYFDNGRVVVREAVNGGLAMDRGGELVVYGIENSDKTSLHELRAEMGRAVLRYMDGGLKSAEMQRATFTVSDLSSSDIDFMFPLLPTGQSLILGVTRTADGVFRVFAGFDHRVTEGLEVSRFLAELRGRLQSFDESAPKPAKQVPTCHFCNDSVTRVASRSKERGMLKVVTANNEEVFCCGSCWNGW